MSNTQMEGPSFSRRLKLLGQELLEQVEASRRLEVSALEYLFKSKLLRQV